MPFFNDTHLDSALSNLRNGANEIHILSAEPATYANVTSNTLGKQTFTAPAGFSAPAAGSPSGRKITSTAISGASVTGTGTAAAWAAVTTGSSRLDAASTLAATQAVTVGNTFSLPGFDIRLPNTGG